MNNLIQLGTAIMVTAGVALGYLNNRIGQKNGQKIDAVHELANGTTTRLSDALATEQQKNAALQETIAKAVVPPK